MDPVVVAEMATRLEILASNYGPRWPHSETILEAAAMLRALALDIAVEADADRT